jgi:protein phosphatase
VLVAEQGFYTMAAFDAEGAAMRAGGGGDGRDSASSAASEATDEMEEGAIRRAWQAAQLAIRRPRVHADIVWAARTDIGRVREHNEDKFDFFIPNEFIPNESSLLAMRGRLWAVADGMGGHSAGQIASETALKTLIRCYFFNLEDGEDTPETALQTALRDANELLHRAAQELGTQGNMGTTVVAAVVWEDQLTVAHIGDSRAYLLRKGAAIRPLTRDHSYVEEQVRRGYLTRAEAETSQYRNYITRSVGMGGSVSADVTSETLEEGDTILLCSDGVTGYLSDAALELYANGKGLSRAALEIVDAANDAGGRDNSTVLLMHVRSIRPFEE